MSEDDTGELMKRAKAAGIDTSAITNAQRRLDAAQYEFDHLVVTPRDRVHDEDLFMKVHEASHDVVSARNQSTIFEWDDKYGNIIYTHPDVRATEVHAVSARITAQQTSFGGLPAVEQSRIRSGVGVEPYKDYLQSDALRIRFSELKQNSPESK